MKEKPFIRMLFCRITDFLLDTIAPQSPLIRLLETMTPHEFILKTVPRHPLEKSKGVIYFFSYHDPFVKAAILEVKSYGNRKIARLLGESVYELLIEELAELELFDNFTSPLLIPIPLTKKSLRKRGWNQCDLVANVIGAIQPKPVIEITNNVLIKIKETEDQVGKGRLERFKNLSHCFEVRHLEILRNRNVIVFDDIVTTGATLLEAKRTLQKAGAKNIICIAIAH